MGNYWWLIGVAMWVVIVGAIVFGKKSSNPAACPSCDHEAGLDDRRRHCPEQDDHNGWSSDRCRCQNDYHWRYESAAT